MIIIHLFWIPLILFILNLIIVLIVRLFYKHIEQSDILIIIVSILVTLLFWLGAFNIIFYGGYELIRLFKHIKFVY